MSLVLRFPGNMPLKRQIVYNGERYVMNCTPPLEVISRENRDSSFIEAVEIKQYNVNAYLTIGRIDKERIVILETRGKETSVIDISELNYDIIEATVTYLNSVGLNGFADSIDNEYYISKINLNSDISIDDLC